MRNTYSARGRAARSALHRAVNVPWPTQRSVSVCTECQGKIHYMVGSTYGWWVHSGVTDCKADPNTTCDRSQITKEDV